MLAKRARPLQRKAAISTSSAGVWRVQHQKPMWVRPTAKRLVKCKPR